MSRRSPYEDTEPLKANGVRGSDVQFEWRHKQLRWNDDKKGRYGFVDIIWNEVEVPVAEVLSEFYLKSRANVREVKEQIIYCGFVYVWVKTVDTYLNEHETRRGQRKNLYVDREGNVLKLAMEKLNKKRQIAFAALGDRWGDIWTRCEYDLAEVPTISERGLCVDGGRLGHVTAMS